MVLWISMVFGYKNEVGDECGDQYKMIGECYTKIHICAGFYDWQWKYYGYAQANGTKGPETSHYDSQDGAGYHAVFLLFQTLPSGSNKCNCEFVPYKVEKCDMIIEECFRVKIIYQIHQYQHYQYIYLLPNIHSLIHLLMFRILNQII